MRLAATGVLVLGGLWAAMGAAEAHFQEILPSTDIVDEQTGGKVTIDLVFTHPMERGPTMEMERPVRFGVKTGGKVTDLAPSLQSKPVDGKQAWEASYDVKQPGDYVFFVEPKPYWEPSEEKMIVHYAKVVVDGYGSGEGWDEMIGLPVEIRPLARPYGLWTGNLFRGVVLHDGKPVPFTDVEVEWVNDGSVKAPADAFITQVIETDESGTFSYAIPRAGWWGFAALTQAKKPMKAPTGKNVPVELGALMWVRAVDMK